MATTPANLAEAVAALDGNPHIAPAARMRLKGSIRAIARIILGICEGADLADDELASFGPLDPASIQDMCDKAEATAQADVSGKLAQFKSALRKSGVHIPDGRGTPTLPPHYKALESEVAKENRAAVRSFLGACAAAGFNKLSAVPEDFLVQHHAQLSAREPRSQANTKTRKIIAFWDEARAARPDLGLGLLRTPPETAQRGSHNLTPAPLATEFRDVVAARFANSHARSAITKSNLEGHLHRLCYAYRTRFGEYPKTLLDLVRNNVWQSLIDDMRDRSNQAEGERYHPHAYGAATLLLEIATAYRTQDNELVPNICEYKRRFTNNRSDIEPTLRRKLLVLTDRKTFDEFLNAPIVALSESEEPPVLSYEKQFLLAWAIMLAVPMWVGVISKATFGSGGTFFCDDHGVVRARFASTGRNILPRSYVLPGEISKLVLRHVAADQPSNTPSALFKDRSGSAINDRVFSKELRKNVSRLATKCHPALCFGPTELRTVIAYIHLIVSPAEDVRHILGADHSDRFDMLERFVEQLRQSGAFQGWEH